LSIENILPMSRLPRTGVWLLVLQLQSMPILPVGLSLRSVTVWGGWRREGNSIELDARVLYAAPVSVPCTLYRVCPVW